MRIDWYKVSGTLILSWTIVTGIMAFVSINAIKSLTIQESLDQENIKKLSSDLRKLSPIVARLNGDITPEFKKSLQQFTEEVKIENAYLKSFKENK